MKRPRRTIRSLLLMVPLLALGACASDGPAYGPPSGAAAVIDMTTTLSFDPKVVTIKTGDTVEWRNRSLFGHSVTDDPAQAKDATDAALPAGAAPFSARVAAGNVYRHTFTVPGTYRYVCLPHEDLGMTGTVIVEAAR